MLKINKFKYKLKIINIYMKNYQYFYCVKKSMQDNCIIITTQEKDRERERDRERS